MLYKVEDKLYIKRLRKLIQVIPSLDKRGDITLTPTNNIIDFDIKEDYEMVNSKDVGIELKNSKREIVEEKKVEETKPEEKTVNKFKKFN